MTDQPAVDILMVVHNGERWLPFVLDGVRAQTWPNIHVHLLDSASTDATADVAGRYPQVTVHRSDENIGIWAGMERLLNGTDAPYVLVLTDVVMAPDYLERGIGVLQAKSDVGAIQARILQGTWTSSGLRREPVIDTLGFAVSRSRRVTNAGQGELDRDFSFDVADIFGVEGAAPLFRRSALDDCRVEGQLIDPHYRIGALGYGDDLDLAWRMRLLGHRQVLVPAMRAWHDRSTTKATAHGIGETVSRRRVRGEIPLIKRQLDWANVRFTMVKNDHVSNVLTHLPWIVLREVMVAGYTLLFEPRVFGILPRFVRLLPAMFRTRRRIMARAVLGPTEMRSLFT